MAQREHRTLEHSRSQTDLRSIKEDGAKVDFKTQVVIVADDSKTSDGASTPTRPAIKKLRRRSTFDWANASPRVRQQRLEDVTAERLADVFFSLHIEGQKEPVYVSEVVERTMNPNFRFFDLSYNGPTVTRQDEMTIKVWAKNERLDDYQYLIEFQVNLRGLQFIGKTLKNYRKPLPTNCIIFHMTDGIYTNFPDPTTHPLVEELGAPKSSIQRVLPTSSYDALMRLATLDQCVQDALATREKIEQQINDLLEKHREPLEVVQSVPTAEGRAAEVEDAVRTERKRLEQLRKKRDDLQRSIKTREELISSGYSSIKEEQSLIPTLESETATTRTELLTTAEEITGQRRRIVEDLQSIFPIEPVPNKSLQFSIMGIPLPNSENYDDTDPDAIAAGLGYVAHIVHNLALYLSKPLPYPLHPMGSTSTIDDPISNIASQSVNTAASGMSGRTYPLFLRGAVRYRFEYAAFLLNKDIELLSTHMGLRVLDVRQTLPNLKYLLYVCSAGKGELPARKAGGIRALFKGGAGSPGNMSRTASQDSVGSEARGRAAEELRRAIAGGGGGKGKEREMGKANGVAVGPNGNMPPPVMPASATKMALQAQKVGLGNRLREGG